MAPTLMPRKQHCLLQMHEAASYGPLASRAQVSLPWCAKGCSKLPLEPGACCSRALHMALARLLSHTFWLPWLNKAMVFWAEL